MADKKSEFICINCPMGCRLSVWQGDGEVVVAGNTCPRGAVYGKQEFQNPTRTVTSVIRLKSGKIIPVKTSVPVPKDKIGEVLAAMKACPASSSGKIGDVVLKNVLGLGADVVLTDNSGK